MNQELTQEFLLKESSRLLRLAKKTKLESGGFGWLDKNGFLDESKNLEAWINFRMTYIFALAVISGDVDSRDYLEHGIRAMKEKFHDDENGGWYSVINNSEVIDSHKKAYELAFALLASSSAVFAGAAGAQELLELSIENLNQYYWEESTGLVVDVWNCEFTEAEEYRGINANMHMVEAFMAVFEATKDHIWLDRALRITEFVLKGAVEKYENLIPEHYLPDLTIQKNYNFDSPDHPFRPFGVVVGHLFEWSRLAIHLSECLQENRPAWLLDYAEKIYQNAKVIGWEVDGEKGFIYTTDFQGNPVTHIRMHWVVAEAIAAAWSFYQETGRSSFLEDYRNWWEYAIDFVIDPQQGFWRHELNSINQIDDKVWKGNPDIYHAYQAVIIALIPKCTGFASGILAMK